MGALGSDTGGSIRIPASLCGVVGLKPTFGRISLRGVVPLSWNLDHPGPMARSVEDVTLLLQVIAGYDPDDPVSVDVPVPDYMSQLIGGVRGWRVAMAGDPFFTKGDPQVLSSFEDEIDLPATDPAMSAGLDATTAAFKRNIKALHDAGIPLVTGSDAGNMAIVAVNAIVISSAPKETIIEKIATCENHVPK